MRHAILENWLMLDGGYLVGYINGHPGYSDGTRVTTPAVLEFLPDEKRALTQYTEFMLGNPASLPPIEANL